MLQLDRRTSRGVSSARTNIRRVEVLTRCETVANICLRRELAYSLTLDVPAPVANCSALINQPDHGNRQVEATFLLPLALNPAN